jgi:hypothetical protein
MRHYNPPVARPRASAQLVAKLREPEWSSTIAISQDQLDAIPDAKCHRRRQAIDPATLSLTRHPVRHHSVNIDRTPTIWIPLDRNTIARLRFMALAIERRTKSKGQPAGAIGRSGLVVLDTLIKFATTNGSGECDPSLEAIAHESVLSVATVVRALERLASTGLITKTRRWQRIRHPQLGLMVSRQIANAYHFAASTKRIWIPDPKPPITRTPPKTARRAKFKLLSAVAKLFRHSPAQGTLLATPCLNAL